MNIKAQCFTNLDKYKREQWPTEFPAVPQIGHWVRAESGKVLKIVSVTWTFQGYLRVELHMI